VNRKPSASKVSHDRWLVSYADFITLLFAFFVVLYAFSKADEKKQAQVAAAIDTGFRTLSIVPSPDATAIADRSRSSTPSALLLPDESAETHFSPDPATRANLEHVRRDLERRLAIQIASRSVTVRLGSEGLVISLREAGFFNTGSAIPKSEATPTLHQIAESLRDTIYDVRVEGHTDDTPIHNTQFDSNWELSTARAVRITRIFIETHAIRPDQLSAEGFAQYRPLADNNSPQGRAENRRVDIVVLPRAVLDLAESESPSDRGQWRKIVDK
jgi:chemotaxis protein MotB